ncbi:MAG TPA: leucyl/phenylalanyl-tRNA--protein transferase [Bacteroidales bacterium]|nr:leucyl/phenylalanyl-tRNA--protein transferase [Bacteroidales bacterium]
MPVYQLPDEIVFPHPSLAEEDGLLAVGGDLTPERLLLAYENGIFPWYNAGDPILWWSPDPRCVLFPGKFKHSKSLRQSIRREHYEFSMNTAFDEVIEACSSASDRKHRLTWLTGEMKAAYKHLHRLNYAWSVETWCLGELAGGLYGVKSGSVFSGESMFYYQRDASKAALNYLCENAASLGIKMIDVQQSTKHLLSLGAEEIPRSEFLEMLK